MIKKKHIALFLILSLFSIDNVYADGACNNDDKKEFREYSKDFKVTYEFNLETKDYTVTTYNPKPDKYRYVITEDEFYDKNEQIIDNKTIYTGISPGKYIIKILENEGGCRSILKEIEIDMPKYNIYYQDPLCEGIEEFVLCQPTYKRDIDRETFEYRIKDYKNQKQEQANAEKQEEKITKDKITNYIKDNLIQIIIIVVFILLVIITSIITIKTTRKSRRLE